MAEYDVICQSCGWEGPHTAFMCTARAKAQRRANGIAWEPADVVEFNRYSFVLPRTRVLPTGAIIREREAEEALRREVAACEAKEAERAARRGHPRS